MNLPFGLKLAQKSFRADGFQRKKMVAAYIEGGRMIVEPNVYKTDPKSFKYGSRWGRIHAEHAVLRHVRDARYGKVYVYRETAAGVPALARPCLGCLQMLRDKGVKTVYYSTENGGYCKEKIA